MALYNEEPDDIEEALSFCFHNDHRLSTWEADFIQSLDDQFRAGRELTEAQLQKLEEIADTL